MVNVNLDPEVLAMQAVAEALLTLEEPARRRILQWACDRFGAIPRQPTAGSVERQDNGEILQGESRSAKSTEDLDFPELFHRANPTTAIERALVASYDIQVRQSSQDFGSQEVNSLLKELGHGVDNITLAFNGMMAQTPKLAMQVQKSGPSQQARKRYRLTHEGIERVKRMLSRDLEDPS